MLTRKKIQTSIALLFGILILVNFLGDKFFFRLDFTADQRYSLSNATKDILAEMNDPVTVTAYFSEDLPPDVSKVKDDFKDLLTEFDSYSGGQIVYEFINPNEDEETEMQAQQSGIRPIMINVRERDQVKQQRAYLGAVLQLGEKKEVIPFLQPGAAMEYALTTNIKKLSVPNKPKVALLQGHGEPPISSLQQLNEVISVMYTLDTLNITPLASIPQEIKTIAVIAPTDSIAPYVFEKLDEFLGRGGRLMLALNSVMGDLTTASGSKVSTGFNAWLREKGIEVEESFLVDSKCSNVMVRQQQGMFVMNTPISFPYLPIISNFANHPITEGLESVVLPFASPIKITPRDTSITYYPIALSSAKAGVQNPPLFFDISKQWKPSDFGMSSIPVGVTVEGRLVGETISKMVVFSDGDFAVNGDGQQAQQLQPDNVSLMVNAIDWLSDDTGLIELRTKGVTSRPLDAQLEDGTKMIVKYLNFLLPIILIIIYGLVRAHIKRKTRLQLKSVDYVK
ncbi:MAG: Gldg family protein [Bacteroidetes bacterium]|nr:Gldg family protein [Bacteroidota bacterium]MBU1678941.1 Gldg family protein [Bacteroidota bacterium]